MSPMFWVKEYLFLKVVFCVSLTEYAQKSGADINKMHESIKVYAADCRLQTAECRVNLKNGEDEKLFC